MRSRIAIQLFFLAFFVGLPMEKAWACGSSDHDHATTFHDQKEQAEPTEKTGCCSTGNCTCDENQAENSGSNKDEPGHCHCPSCGFSLLVTPILLASPFELSLPAFSDFLLKKQAFYFAERQPEEVVLPIWQPPQLISDFGFSRPLGTDFSIR